MSSKIAVAVFYVVAGVLAYACSYIGNRKDTRTQSITFNITWRYLLNIAGYVLLATAALATIKPVTPAIYLPLLAYLMPGLLFAIGVAMEDTVTPKDVVVDRFIRISSGVSLGVLTFCATYSMLF